ncbi:MAG: hypothetical protein ACP5SF_05080 [Thermoplasmata archaeon]
MVAIMKKISVIAFLSIMLLSTMQISSAQKITINEYSSISDNATQNLTNLLNRLTFVINAIAISILSVLWIWEGLFLFFHKDDREGLIKFKHDLPIMVISSIIILGASIIVNIISFIAHG